MTTTNLFSGNVNSNGNSKMVQGPKLLYTELRPELVGAVFSSHKIRSAETLRQPHGAVLETQSIVGVGGCWLVSCLSVVRERSDDLFYILAHIGTVGLLLVVDNCKDTLEKLHRKSVASACPQHSK